MECLELRHILVDFDHIFSLTFDREHILARVQCGPNQVTTITKCCVGELRERINYEVSVSADAEVSSRRSKPHRLGISLAATKILDIDFDNVSVFGLFLCKLEVACLDIRAVDHDDLAVLVSHHGHFIADFDNKCGLIKPDSYVVARR